MAVLGLCFCARAFSSCGERGPLFIAVRGPLIATASLAAEHRLQTRRLSSCGSRARLLRGMWDLPRPGLEPVLHWQADSQPLNHQGSPVAWFLSRKFLQGNCSCWKVLRPIVLSFIEIFCLENAGTEENGFSGEIKKAFKQGVQLTWSECSPGGFMEKRDSGSTHLILMVKLALEILRWRITRGSSRLAAFRFYQTHELEVYP